MRDSEQCPRRSAFPTRYCTCSTSCLTLHQRPRTRTKPQAQHHGRSRKTSWWYHCKFQSTTGIANGAINALLLAKINNITFNESEGWWGRRWREYFKRRQLIHKTTFTTTTTTTIYYYQQQQHKEFQH